MWRRIALLLMTLLVAFTSGASAQAKSDPMSLTYVLQQISAHHHVKLSFSPTMTDKVYPENTRTDGEISEVLRRVLNGTGFSYKMIDNTVYYVFKLNDVLSPKTYKGATALPQMNKMRARAVILHKVDSLSAVITDTICLRKVVPMIDDISLLPTYHQQSMHPLSDTSVSSPWKLVKMKNKKNPILPFLPPLSIKSNLLYDATTSVNLGFEIGLTPKLTLDISGNYNPWTFSEYRKMKHWLIQPEMRYWLCQYPSGHFFGLHIHYAQFNFAGMLPWGFHSGKMFGNIESSQMSSHCYQGWLLGAGVGYGYHWMLSENWGIETEFGMGYAYLEYDKYRCERCSDKLKREHQNYFGVTKAAITLMFRIK